LLSLRDDHQARNNSLALPAVRIDLMHGALVPDMAGMFALMTALRVSGSPSWDCR
jgi:hypothetical protein